MADIIQKIVALLIFGLVVFGLLWIGIMLLPFVLALLLIVFVWYAIKMHQLRKALREGMQEYEQTRFSDATRPRNPRNGTAETGETIEVDYVEISEKDVEEKR